MRVTIASMAVLGVVATVAAVPAAGQQDRWDVRDLAVEGGAKAKEFRLLSDSGGSALILQCLNQAVGAGFAFAESVAPTQRVTVRGVPGPQRNVAVQPIGDRALRIASGRGRDFLLRMLSAASSVSVDASGQRERFQVFGSDTIVSQCIQQQDAGWEVSREDASMGGRRCRPEGLRRFSAVPTPSVTTPAEVGVSPAGGPAGGQVHSEHAELPAGDCGRATRAPSRTSDASLAQFWNDKRSRNTFVERGESRPVRLRQVHEVGVCGA